MILVSACLAGFKCRYNGTPKPNKRIIELVKQGRAIPVCPELLAGLPTPRPAVEIKNGKVITLEGKNLTPVYKLGAKRTLELCKIYSIREAILKERSPTCGVHFIYDGTFSDKVIPGEGICAALFKKNKIKVLSEEQF